MSTVVSPRPSIALSSRRTSTSTDTASQAQAAERGSLRRNRAALRDYYGLKGTAPESARDAPSIELEKESELDKPSFNPQEYVSTLLTHETHEGVLKIAAGLVSEIRTLDGEKKALVYDNYSKLIAATDTIRNMREKMDPMTPTTSTLPPAIGHIAETASALSSGLKKAHGGLRPDAESQSRTRREEQATVRWALAAPTRLQRLLDEGSRGDAEAEWREVEALIEKWNGVAGINELRTACLSVLDGAEEEGEGEDG